MPIFISCLCNISTIIPVLKPGCTDIACDENSAKDCEVIILSAVQPMLDPLEFAYSAGIGAEDAKLFVLGKVSAAVSCSNLLR